MADNKCSKRSSRKDRAVAEATTRRNMLRRAAREARLQKQRDAKASHVRVLRKRGAVIRAERRFAAGQIGLTVVAKVKAALALAEARQ